jgi:hypothetical protein
MRTNYLFLSTLFITLLLASCSRELSFEIKKSRGTLKSPISGSCLPSIISGVYNKDSVLTAANYIDMQVNVFTRGRYLIQSDTLNGFSFKGEGFVDSSGINTVRLYAKGKPVAPGAYSFYMNYDTSTCPVIVIVAGVEPEANYSIDCATANLAGNYMEGTSMNTLNTFTITTTVTAPGKYTIVTPEVNGVRFSATGTYSSASPLQLVVLKASGTPVAQGTFDYPVTGNGSTCSFKVIYAPRPAPASFTLDGAPNACVLPVINGTYNTSVPLNASNTIVLPVNVTTPGAYSFTTNIVNGMRFSASGAFTATGRQNITLTGSGTPVDEGVHAFQFQAGLTACTFNVTVNKTIVATGIYTCKIDGVLTTFNDRADFTHEDFLGFGIVLIASGYTGPPSGNASQLQLIVENNNHGPVKAGSYNVDGFLLPNGYEITVEYVQRNPDFSVTRWLTSSTIFTPNPPFTITITSISATRVRGTFSGKVTNAYQGSTLTKTISEGVFDLPVR